MAPWRRASSCALVAGLLVSACLVDGFEVNPNYGQGSGGSGAGSSGGKSSSGDAGEPAAGGSDVAQGGKSTGTAGSSGDAGESTVGMAGAGGVGATTPPTCQYSEQRDTTNMRAYPDETGYAEETMLALAEGELVICGTIDEGHFSDELVDVDSFTIDVSEVSEILVTAELAEPNAQGRLYVVAKPAGGADRRTTASAGRAALWRPVSSQLINVSVVLDGPTALTEPIPYVVRVRTDDVAARCPALATGDATATYTEHLDGSGTENDTIAFDPVLYDTYAATATAADAPEATGAELDLGAKVLINGSSASRGTNVSYRDADTYAFNPGSASLLTFRVDWQGDVDFDLFAFHADDFASRARTYEPTNAGPEFMTLAADASSSWWLMAALSSLNTAQLPKDYQVTVCTEDFP